MLSQNYRNKIIDICCRMVSTDGEVTLNERIWMNKLIENNKSAKIIVDSISRLALIIKNGNRCSIS